MALVNLDEHAQRTLDVEHVRTHPADFNRRFPDWLLANYPVFTDFCRAGDAVRERGFTEYSAYVITNVLRWRANVRGLQFKMTNTFIPDLARLYNATRGPLFTTSTRFGKETT